MAKNSHKQLHINVLAPPLHRSTQSQNSGCGGITTAKGGRHEIPDTASEVKWCKKVFPP
jgi:hypothetical protein